MSQTENRGTGPETISERNGTTDQAGEALEGGQQATQPQETPPDGVEKAPHKKARLLYIDHLRVLLTTLVIMHHLAITYGAAGSWYYQDPAKDTLTTALLTILTATNQAFFMGFFFFISAYFTPPSYRRKGTGSFLRDRFLRLGIPLVVYELVLNPIVIYMAQPIKQPYLSFWGGYLLNLRSIGDGPLWFVEALLIFACLYVLWRWLMRGSAIKQDEVGKAPKSWQVLIVLLCVALASFGVRIVLPLGWVFEPMNLQFPFFPQYITLYILGIIAYRRNWLNAIPDSMGRLWGWIAIIGIVLFPVLAIGGGAGHSIAAFSGGLHWQAFAYALWEEFVCMGMCIWLLVFFRRRFNGQSILGTFLSANAYTAYIIHPVVIVGLAVAAQSVHLYPLLKYVLAVLIAVPLCFLVSELIRKIPYADRIL